MIIYRYSLLLIVFSSGFLEDVDLTSPAFSSNETEVTEATKMLQTTFPVLSWM